MLCALCHLPKSQHIKQLLCPTSSGLIVDDVVVIGQTYTPEILHDQSYGAQTNLHCLSKPMGG